ncbi:MAG: hypothetical protein PVS3B1_17580 [Ktedonobacteraceae bacterium]
MRFLRTSSLFGLAILFVLLLAACGGATDTTSTTSSYGAGGTTPAANQAAPTQAAPATEAVVKTMTATVQGKSEMILTDAKGLTLYYFKPDTKTTSACTGACAGNWPPLMASGSSAPTSTTTLPGKLTAQTSTNGAQVQYNGHFLYTFVSDKAPGDTKGEGVGGKWHVAAVDLAELA